MSVMRVSMALSVCCIMTTIASAREFSLDFREAASLPNEMVADGDLQAGNIYLTKVTGEQVLAVDLSGVTNSYGANFRMEGLQQEVKDDDPLHLYFHYKPAVAKSVGGKVNFRLSLTINGVQTVFDGNSGVINADLPLDCSDWWLASINLQQLLDHWREQTGSNESMFVNAIHIGPGAIGKAERQYRDVLYFRGLHLGSTATPLKLSSPGNMPGSASRSQDNLDINSLWIPQGSRIRLQPETSGTVYLTRYRMPYLNYVDDKTRNFDEAEFALFAAVTQSVVAGKNHAIETDGLLPGFYDLVLVNNGILEAVHRFHMAFRNPQVSPHYAVSVELSGQRKNLPSYYSFRKSEYIKDWGVDGKNLSITTVKPGKPQPVNAHSWAGISTDDYPLTVRVKVLPAAGNPHLDGSAGITLPLTSAKVLPSSYGILCRIEGGDTIVFTLNRPEKLLVVPNYDEAMEVYTKLAVGHVPLQSIEEDYKFLTKPKTFHGEHVSHHLSEGYRNPLVFLGRGPDTFVSDLGLKKNDPDTLVILPGDRPTQEQLSAAETVWFEPGGHDLSRLGEHPNYRTYIKAGQTYYLEEGAFVAAGFKKDETSGSGDCRLVGRGTVTGINHFWGGGSYDENSIAVEIDKIEGSNVVDRQGWGIDGGDLISDIALMGAWHGNCDGLDSLDHCTVRNSFLMAHDDNLKLNNHTYAEHLVIYMLGLNAHPIMFKEMSDKVVFANAVVKDVDVIGYWKHAYPNMSGFHRAGPGAIACYQTRNVTIRNAQFSDIRIESPHLARVFTFYNAYSEGKDWPYIPDWLEVSPNNADKHSSIDGLTFKNITVTTPFMTWQRSLLGSAFPDSFANVSFINLDINGVRITEANKDEYFEISGYVNGTDPVDGGHQRIDIPNPVTNVTFRDSPPEQQPSSRANR